MLCVCGTSYSKPGRRLIILMSEVDVWRNLNSFLMFPFSCSTSYRHHSSWNKEIVSQVCSQQNIFLNILVNALFSYKCLMKQKLKKQ